MKYNDLTPQEEAVIVGKGTEAPGSGEYEHNDAAGVYLCRRCDAPLYDSRDKFDARCGWPSFDDELPGAVKHSVDADGQRTEISCMNCGAHLGHVFIGEKMTAKDTRHCVNSLSMRFVPTDIVDGQKSSAVLGGGCFWCLETAFKQLRGVMAVTSGYSGGAVNQPTYEQVSGGQTGHAEVVKIDFDATVINYQTLLEIFFSLHDPTTLNRQGSDVGEQYRSIIFYQTWQQKLSAEKLIQQLATDKIYDQPIVTELKPLIKFYPAEDYHQDYYAKNPQAGYCQLVINPKLDKFRQKFKQWLAPADI